MAEANYDHVTPAYASNEHPPEHATTCSGEVDPDAVECGLADTPPAVTQEELTDEMKLLSKLKSEEMFELRKLKHHQRPVSEFSSKSLLEQILATKCKQALCVEEPVSDAPAQASSSSLTHSRVKEFDSRAQATEVQSPSDLRPESVQLEIRGLFERRVVSEVLQSPIQAELERVVRDQQQQQRRPRRRRARGSPPPHRREATGAAGRVMAAVRHGARSRGALYHRRGRNFRPPADGNYPLPARDQTRILEHIRQSPALNSLDQEAREEIVSEVSNLVHQQLVTSALSGEFRGVLEFHIQERADRMSEGVTGENFLRSQRLHSRQSQSPVDHDRTEAGTASGFNEVQREMRDMKNQLAELKQMMRVSFDLQMDIQRSIRQEVSAALSILLSSPSQPLLPPQASTGVSVPNPCPLPTLRRSETSSVTQPDGAAQAVKAGHCVICSDGIIDSVVYRCGHMCVCMACGLELKGQGLKCPICRAPITDVIRAYTSMLQ